MALNLRLQPKLAQHLVMTPQLQQAIRLLQLNHLEMAEALREEIAQNPVLEADGSPGEGPMEPVPVAESLSSPPEASETFVALREGYSPRTAMGGEAPSLESWHARPESLTDHLHWQVTMAALGETERGIAHLLVEEIDDDGYLPADAAPFAQTSFEVGQEDVERVVGVIQTFDPVGIGARDLRECLLAQARVRAPLNDLAIRIIDDHLPSLSKPAFRALQKQLGANEGDIKEAIRFIGQLDPHPGRVFTSAPPHYIVPDLFVTPSPSSGAEDEEEFVVTANEEALPSLRISPLYHRGHTDHYDGDTKTYVQEKLRAAHWLMRSVAMRQKTMCQVMQSILRFQRSFFTQGPQGLRPLILRDVAADVGLHESTVSRVTTNKYVHTPRGLFELKFFFNSTIRGCHGSHVASASVRSHIERLIAQENKHAPLSDQKIVELLKQSDISIARRTVAKYRKMLRKDSSCARKRDV